MLFCFLLPWHRGALVTKQGSSAVAAMQSTWKYQASGTGGNSKESVGWGMQGNAAILLRSRDSSSSTLASRFLWATEQPQEIGGECATVLGSDPGLSNPTEPQIWDLRIQFGIQTQLLIDGEKGATAEVSSSHPRCELCGGVSPPLLTAVGALGFQLSLC